MKVEVLYFDGCPHREAAVRRLKDILAEEGVDVPVNEIRIAGQDAAESLGFPGSPTIRINGIDVDPSAPAQAAGLTCRTYPGAEGRHQGIPPDQCIRSAIRAARQEQAR